MLGSSIVIDRLSRWADVARNHLWQDGYRRYIRIDSLQSAGYVSFEISRYIKTSRLKILPVSPGIAPVDVISRGVPGIGEPARAIATAGGRRTKQRRDRAIVDRLRRVIDRSRHQRRWLCDRKRFGFYERRSVVRRDGNRRTRLVDIDGD